MGLQIVEINGIKMEVDLREAKTIDTYKVGGMVKLLVPVYNGFESYAGVIIGFDAFKVKPTIIVAYLEAAFGKAEVKIAYICEGCKYEIVHASDGDIPLSKKSITDLLGKDIADKQKALDEANWRLGQFEAWFGRYFVDAKTNIEAPA